MPGAETAKLVASLELKDNFSAGIRNASQSLGKLSTSIAKSRAVAVGLGVGLERVAETGISALGNAIGDGIAGAQELERAQQQTQAVIESTGGVAGITAQQVRDLANAQEELTTVDDKNVQRGEDVLLLYTAIGKKTFPTAVKAATDMAVAMAAGDATNADVAESAKKVGKALQDPIKGIGALSKAGVKFTKAEEDKIKALAKSGKLEEAQGELLKALEVRYGKAGEAAGKGFGGDIRRANDAIEEAKIAIAQGLIPAVGEVARELSTTLKDPAVISGLRDFGKGIGEAIKGIVAFAKTVPWGSIANSLRAAAGFAKDLLNAFLGLPDWVKTAVITGWGLNKLTGGALTDIFGTLATGLIKGVLGMNAGVVNINAGTVTGVGGLPGGGVSDILKLIPIAGIVAATIAALETEVNTHLTETGGKPLGPIDIFNPVAMTGFLSDALANYFGSHTVKTDDDETHTLIASGGGADRHGTPGIPAAVHDKETEAAIETLRGQLPGADRGAGQVPETETHGALLNATTEALRNSDIVKTTDVERLRSTVYDGLTGLDALFAPGIKLDASQITDLRASTDKTGTAVDAMHGDLSEGLQIVGTNTTSVENAVKGADQQISSSGQLVQGAASLAGYRAAAATNAASSNIVGAIQANRPIIDVQVNISATSVEKTVVVNDRNGPSGGSATDDLGYPGHPGR